MAGLALWLDASDLSTITQASGAVSQWKDKSGNNNHVANGAAAQQPTTGTRTLNGRNVIDFDGGDGLALTSGIDRTNGYTIMAVVAFDDDANKKSLLGGSAGSFVFRANPTENLQIVRQAQSVLLTGSTALGAGTASILMAKTANVGNSIWINGVLDGTNASNPLYNTDLTFIGGEGSVFSNGFNGYIAELLIYKGLVANSDVNRIGVYLAAKWGPTWTNI